LSLGQPSPTTGRAMRENSERVRTGAPGSRARGDHGNRGVPQSVSIVVPTYREAPNIPILVDRVRDALAASGIEWELILVDDDSCDGSDRIVADLAKGWPVRLEIRRDLPRDLSLSVLRGFQLACFDTIVVLDADLSHPPERIGRLLAALDGECDMVVGSRYILGGSVDCNWSWWRLMNSRLATALTAPLTSCSDPMSGFFAVRRRALPERSGLDPIGYKIGLELMVRGRLCVKEVPIDFADRAAGHSKVSSRVRVEFLRQLYRLYRFRYGSLAGILSLAGSRAAGILIDVVGFLAFQAVGLDHRLARLVSLGSALGLNRLVSRQVTRGTGSSRAAGIRPLAFGMDSLAGLGASIGCYLCLTAFVPAFARHRLTALMCGICIGSACEFLYGTARIRFARRAR